MFDFIESAVVWLLSLIVSTVTVGALRLRFMFNKIKDKLWIYTR